jgi:hypothetical protein
MRSGAPGEARNGYDDVNTGSGETEVSGLAMDSSDFRSALIPNDLDDAALRGTCPGGREEEDPDHTMVCVSASSAAAR